MAKLRKMLGSADSPYIVSLMRLIETQSITTIARWCVDYAEKYYLPIYEKAYPSDNRLRNALDAANDWLAGKLKPADMKKLVSAARGVAKEAEENPAAQAAAKAVWQAAASGYTPTHSLGLAFYGAAAIAYSVAGLNETPETYDKIAAGECARIEAALRAIAVLGEKNPAKINWNC